VVKSEHLEKEFLSHLANNFEPLMPLTSKTIAGFLSLK